LKHKLFRNFGNYLQATEHCVPLELKVRKELFFLAWSQKLHSV